MVWGYLDFGLHISVLWFEFLIVGHIFYEEHVNQELLFVGLPIGREISFYLVHVAYICKRNKLVVCLFESGHFFLFV